MGRYKLAVGSWAFLNPPYDINPWTLEKVCEYLSELKYEGVELYDFPHASPEVYRTKQERADLLSMIKSYDLEIANFCYIPRRVIPYSPYELMRKQHEKLFDIKLEFCCDLDIKRLRVDTGPVGPTGPADQIPGIDYKTAIGHVVSAWKRYSERAEDSGIILNWEFESGFFINRPSEIISIVEEVGSPYFTVLFDTCHAHACGIGLRQTPPLDVIEAPLSKIAAEFMRKLKGHIGCVHLIDNNNTLNTHITSAHTPFGQGVIDFDEVMRALPEAGYNEGWLTIDCEEEAEETAKKGKEFIDDLLEKHGYK